VGKQCTACLEFKDIEDFEKRKDSKDGYRNMCKICHRNPPTDQSRKVKNSIGDIFNHWTVISRANNKKDGSTNWNCKCICGTLKVVSSSSLRDGASKSCGCLQKATMQAKRSDESLLKKHYRSYKSGANYKWRNYEFRITYEEFKKLAMSSCYYCGQAPSDKRHHYHKTKGKMEDIFILVNGVDRVDNTKGYTIDNSVSCCGMCNQMKLDYSLDDFLTKIKQIYLRSIKCVD